MACFPTAFSFASIREHGLAGHAAAHGLFRPTQYESAVSDQPPEDIGTIAAALVIAVVLVGLVIIGAVLAIDF
jgi:hypothetical protein